MQIWIDWAHSNELIWWVTKNAEWNSKHTIYHSLFWYFLRFCKSNIFGIKTILKKYVTTQTHEITINSSNFCIFPLFILTNYDPKQISVSCWKKVIRNEWILYSSLLIQVLTSRLKKLYFACLIYHNVDKIQLTR